MRTTSPHSSASAHPDGRRQALRRIGGRWTGGAAGALLFLLALGLTAPSTALAQWSSRPQLLALPAADAEWGFRAGGFRIYPQVTTEGRYDSNLFRQAASEAPVDAFVMRVMPGLSVSNPRPATIGLRFDVKGDARFYFGDERAVDEQQNAGVTANLAVELFPRGPVVLRVFDQFRRALETRNIATPRNYNRNFNLAGAQVLFRPGGGALELGLEYAYAIDVFDEFARGDLSYHDFGFHTEWQFYPLTSAFLDVDFKLNSYDEALLNPEFGIANTDSMPLRANIGLTGQITRRLSMLVQAGWAEGFYEDGPSFSGPIGLARLSYRFTPTTLVQVGYARDYEDSLYANYYGEHRVFLAAQQQLFRRLDIKVSGSYHLVDYAAFTPSDDEIAVSQTSRTEHVVRLATSLRVDVTRWLGFNVGYQLDTLLSDFEVAYQSVVADDPTFHRHQVYTSVVGRY